MLKILLIEDNPGDARLVEEMLKDSGVAFGLERSDRLSSGMVRLKLEGFDVILLDLGLPDSEGFQTLIKLNEIRPEAPVIVLTGLADEAIGTQAVKEGAQDYLIKGQVDKNLLMRSINYAVERKKLEKTVVEQGRRFEAFFENSITPMAFLDREFNFIRVNKAYADADKREISGFPGHNHFEFYPSDAKAIFEEVVRTKTAFQTFARPFNYPNHSERGVSYWDWTLVPILDDKGEVESLALSLLDVTERKKTERLITNILESVDEGFIIVDKDYRIISANRAYLEEVKMGREEVIGGHCYKISHRLDRPCFEVGEDCPVRHTFETGQPGSYIHTHYDKKGEPIFIETKSFPIKDESGKIVSVIETLNDITEKRKLEEQLRQSQKMEAIGTMAGGIAHDFNNILTGVIGYTEMLKMDMKENDPLMFNVDQVLLLSDKAVSLVKDIMTFGRKQLTFLEPMDLNEAIRKTEKFLYRIMGEDIDLKVNLADKPITVMADKTHLEQVIMNLSTNARDAMPGGGTLTITTETAAIDDPFIKRHGFGAPGDYAVLSVTDTGIGMDRETLQRIFEPFFTTKEEGKGTGLGLAIVYGVIKQHNGYINAYSEPGRGTTFKAYLPLVRLKVAYNDKVPETPLKRGSETVLVAEDEEYVRRLVKDVLEEFGYKVIEAFDGEDAIAKLIENKDKVDLLYLDVVMPKMSGKEAYKKALEIRPGIRAVFTSGYPSDILSKKDIVEGKVDFVSKPVSPRVLLTKVREALDR